MTPIEWTEETWNPVRGCSRISEGCLNCYAERQAARNLPGMKSPTTQEPFAIMTPAGPSWTGKVELIHGKLPEPAAWKRPRRIFVNSMSDLFHECLPFWEIDSVFDGMLRADWHDYQILTKRADRMFAYFDSTSSRSDYLAKLKLWMGVSVESPGKPYERIRHLLKIPARLRFISYEPALEGIDFNFGIEQPWCGEIHAHTPDKGCWNRLNWVIIGGESGPRARPFNLKWARDTIRQCHTAGVPVFLKQIGSNPVGEKADQRFLAKIKHSKGGDLLEWPLDLRKGTREYPAIATAA